MRRFFHFVQNRLAGLTCFSFPVEPRFPIILQVRPNIFEKAAELLYPF